jgi:hypothetical protein
MLKFDGNNANDNNDEELVETIEIDFTRIEPTELVQKYYDLIMRVQSPQELNAYLNEFYTETYKNAVIEGIEEQMKFLAEISMK